MWYDENVFHYILQFSITWHIVLELLLHVKYIYSINITPSSILCNHKTLYKLSAEKYASLSSPSLGTRGRYRITHTLTCHIGKLDSSVSSSIVFKLPCLEALLSGGPLTRSSPVQWSHGEPWRTHFTSAAGVQAAARLIARWKARRGGHEPGKWLMKGPEWRRCLAVIRNFY